MTPKQTGQAVDLEALQDAWKRSDQVFGWLSPETALARPIPLRQPFLFYVGHLPAFAWNHMWRRVAGWPAFDSDLDLLFERGIDPPDDGEAPAADVWPEPESVLAYRDRVRACLSQCLDQPRVREVLPMVLEHELMHHETLIYMIQQLPQALKTAPGDSTGRQSLRPPQRTPISIPAGRVALGATRNGRFRWDNEFPGLDVEVPAFQLDSVPVTNREFREFVENGGYEDRRCWTDDAWEWIRHREHRGPGSWTAARGEIRVRTLFGDRAFEDAADWPASVMHCEAAAFARGEGARLQTEAEYHRAAFGTPDAGLREHPWGDDPPAQDHGNFDFRQLSPLPVGSHPAGASAFGVQELVGNGWEWTSTAFGPLPGFEPLEGYRGYSADFFDDRHFVMLGASWATDARLVRRSFRNWFQPHYPYMFSKFRCARDS